MEETKNIQQTPIAQAQAVQKPEALQTAAAQPTVTPTTPNKKSPLFVFLLLGLIIVLAIAAFFMLSKTKNNQAPQTSDLLVPSTSQTYPTVQPTTSPSPASTEEQAVDGISIDKNIDADFETVDNDLKQL